MFAEQVEMRSTKIVARLGDVELLQSPEVNAQLKDLCLDHRQGTNLIEAVQGPGIYERAPRALAFSSDGYVLAILDEGSTSPAINWVHIGRKVDDLMRYFLDHPDFQNFGFSPTTLQLNKHILRASVGDRTEAIDASLLTSE